METIPKTLCLELARVTEVEAGLRALLEKYGTSPLDGDIRSQLLDRLSPKYAHNLKLYWNLKKEQGRGTRELTTHSNSRVSN
jgi:hypothetical protein